MDALLFRPKPQSKVRMPKTNISPKTNTMYHSDTSEAFTDVQCWYIFSGWDFVLVLHMPSLDVLTMDITSKPKSPTTQESNIHEHK